MPGGGTSVNLFRRTATVFTKDIFKRTILAAAFFLDGLSQAYAIDIRIPFALTDINEIPCSGPCTGEANNPDTITAAGTIFLDPAITVGSVLDDASDIYSWDLSLSLLEMDVVVDGASFGSSDTGATLTFATNAFFDVLSGGLAPNLTNVAMGEGILFSDGGDSNWGWIRSSTGASGSVLGVQTDGSGSGILGANNNGVIVASGNAPPAVPLPAGLPLLASAGVFLWVVRRRRA